MLFLFFDKYLDYEITFFYFLLYFDNKPFKVDKQSFLICQFIKNLVASNFIIYFARLFKKIYMEINILTVLLFMAAYLLGSIPNAVWVGKMLYGIDVREEGSKNAGATNTIRVLGWKAGLPVLLLDIFKGFLAVKLIYVYDLYVPGTMDFVNLQLALGACAVVGHIFPVFAGFRGGKGVASLFGIILAIVPMPTLLTLGVFLLILVTTGYVSLSSIIAGFAFPFLNMFVFKTTVPSLIIFSLIVTILLLLTHQKNIERLLRREESKASFLIKKKKTKLG